MPPRRRDHAGPDVGKSTQLGSGVAIVVVTSTLVVPDVETSGVEVLGPTDVVLEVESINVVFPPPHAQHACVAFLFWDPATLLNVELHNP